MSKIKKIVRYRKTNLKAKEPKYATKGAGGMDFYLPNDVTFKAKEVKYIDLGIILEIPNGYTLEVIGRSSMGAKTPLRVVNGTQLIDSDYRGTIKPRIKNISNTKWTVKAGERIVQGVLRKYKKAILIEKNKLSNTERGAGGYGSTGK